MELPTLIIWIVVNILDLHSSFVAISKWGVDVEKNAWARMVCKRFGIIKGLSIYKSVFATGWGLVLIIPLGWIALLLLSGIVFYNMANNYRIIKKYENYE